jgi:choline dehydrogenase-like flavoprotein
VNPVADGLADILIIGAGASGAAVAWRLATAGFKVVCLEQGGWQDPAAFPANGTDWEVRWRSDWHYDPNRRRRPEDYPVNDAESDVTPLMFNGVGGSTIHWTAHTPRFHPSDFRVKSLDGVADDWPLTYFDLEPFYDLNDRMMGCCGIAGDPAYPPKPPRSTPPLPLGPDGERMARAFDRLGWHWWPSDSYINSVPYGGRDACNHCGQNGLGCTRKAKGTVDVTYWPEAIKMGAEVRAWCRVFEITTSPDGRVTGAGYFDRQGNRQHQPARAVVLAGNGIGTPRLMLLSKSPRHPHGLANSSGLVGKNLMFHPVAFICGLFREDMQSYRGAIGNVLFSHEFYETDNRRDFVRGYSFQMVRSTGPALTAIGFSVPGVAWGVKHHEEFAERFGRTSLLAVMTEDLPEIHNEVTIDPKLTDGNGIPAPKVRYRVSANTRKMLDHGVRHSRRVFEAAGAHRVIASQLLRNCGWHLMGTARMGSDAKSSVVNRYGQAHDTDNLFIVDGSLFVTCGAVNPTPTIQALALWVAEYIVKNRGDLKASSSP